MDFIALFNFLDDLQRNNNKDWLDRHRARYLALRDDFIKWLDALDLKLGEVDPDYYHTPGNKGINRINNNLKFHPNRPVYKDHFGAALDKAPGTGDFYIEIGLENSLLAGGLWRPAPEKLRSVRDAIDYNGGELKKILSGKSFRAAFGGLYQDDPLKTTPKGFYKDHPHIDLLRHKTFAVVHPLNRETVLKKEFQDHILHIYLEMLPFRRYLNKAISI
jgi:uncharacterized protein (TIGR02453 family)